MQLELRSAKTEDLQAVEGIYLSFLTQEETGPRWTVWQKGVYPTGETARQALEAGELYVLTDGGTVVGSVILNRKEPEEYASVAWTVPAEPGEALVIHTLCMDPERKGLGLGKAMVSHIIHEARAQGCRAIRLDTGSQNAPAVGLYKKMGFSLAGEGTILLDGQIPHKGHVFMEYGL